MTPSTTPRAIGSRDTATRNEAPFCGPLAPDHDHDAGPCADASARAHAAPRSTVMSDPTPPTTTTPPTCIACERRPPTTPLRVLCLKCAVRLTAAGDRAAREFDDDAEAIERAEGRRPHRPTGRALRW